LVTKEEIANVAKLMRIDLADHLEHIDRVKKMLEYFEILDKAGVESEEIIVQELPISSLREDKHIPYDEKILENLKTYKEKYIRAPKMI